MTSSNHEIDFPIGTAFVLFKEKENNSKKISLKWSQE